MERRKGLVVFWALTVLAAFVVAYMVLSDHHPLRPRLNVKESVVDMGVVDPSDDSAPREVKFEITNVGKGRLRFTRIAAGCPCTNPVLDKSELRYGEEATLTVQANLPVWPGPWSDFIMLHSNDPANPITKLGVTAYIELQAVVIPDPIEITGLRTGERRIVELEILGPTVDDGFHVSEVRGSSESISLVRLSEPECMDKSGRKRWKADISVTSRNRRLWESEVNIFTSDRRDRCIVVPVFVQEKLDIDTKPRILALRRGEEGSAFQAYFEVVGAFGTALSEPAELECPEWLDVRPASDSDASGRLRFCVTAEAPTDGNMRSGEIRIVVKPGNRRINVPVLVFGE